MSLILLAFDPVHSGISLARLSHIDSGRQAHPGIAFLVRSFVLKDGELIPMLPRVLDMDATLLPACQPHSVLQAAAHCHGNLKTWAASLPSVIAAREGMALPWSAYMAAVACQGRINEDVLDTARFILTSVELDDVLEGNGAGGTKDQKREHERLVSACWNAVEHGCRDDDRTRLPDAIVALGDIAGRVRRRCASPTYWETLLILLREMLDAFAKEATWRSGERPWPTLESHLANGQHSVQSPFCWWLFAASSARQATMRHEDADHLRAAVLSAGWCIRVANDINGLERDRRSHAPNAVTLAAAEWGCDETQAAERLDHLARQRLMELKQNASQAPASLTNIYRVISRGTAFLMDWYRVRHDIRFTPEDHAAFAAAGVDLYPA